MTRYEWPVTPGWRSVGVSAEGWEFDLDGVNPWKYEWVTQPERIDVAHPTYSSQRHKASVSTLSADGREVRFAVVEVSAGAYAFYLPDPS